MRSEPENGAPRSKKGQLRDRKGYHSQKFLHAPNGVWKISVEILHSPNGIWKISIGFLYFPNGNPKNATEILGTPFGNSRIRAEFLEVPFGMTRNFTAILVYLIRMISILPGIFDVWTGIRRMLSAFLLVPVAQSKNPAGDHLCRTRQLHLMRLPGFISKMPCAAESPLPPAKAAFCVLDQGRRPTSRLLNRGTLYSKT